MTTTTTCANCGADFPEGLLRCPDCRTERDLGGELHPRQNRRRARRQDSSEATPLIQEIHLSWQSAWRVAIATTVVAAVVSLAAYLIFFVALGIAGWMKL